MRRMMNQRRRAGKAACRSGSGLNEVLGLPAERSALGAPHRTAGLRSSCLGRPVRGEHRLRADRPAFPRRSCAAQRRRRAAGGALRVLFPSRDLRRGLARDGS